MKFSSKRVFDLTKWFEKQQRPLPWRKLYLPYEIWISEIMLQQTQVATVVPYFERFMAAFPMIEALARAELDKVLLQWSGLGYYSRARNLHKAAVYLCENHAGKFPQTREEMLKVPGIGPYTAGAILSIAFEKCEPIVDGNVQRVFARFHAFSKPLESKEAKEFFWATARQWVEASQSPRNLNQALMELGATVCTKHNPACGRCPLRKDCRALKLLKQEAFPPKKVRPDKIRLRWLGFVFEHKESIFLRKREPKEWWSGLWDLPTVNVETDEFAGKTAELLLGKVEGVINHEPLGTVRHTVTHHDLYLSTYRVQMKSRAKMAEWKGEWIPKEKIKELPKSSLLQKVLRSW